MLDYVQQYLYETGSVTEASFGGYARQQVTPTASGSTVGQQ